MAWRIEYTDTARKHLKKLDREIARRILDYMDDRLLSGGDPRGAGKPLAGQALGNFWRYRVGDYRIICDIEDRVMRVLVVQIGHRKSIYR